MRYSKKNYPLRNINDDLYQVVAEFHVDKVKDVQGLKTYLQCDSVFKFKQTESYLFCIKIEEAQII